MDDKHTEKDHHLSYGPLTGPCSVCGLGGSRACGRCRVDFYCGKDHQMKDWQRHRRGCGCIAVGQNSKLGRHLVASKDIPAGTVLMREVPLISIPKPPAPSISALCVGCCRVQEDLDSVEQCNRCGWPICNEACSQHPDHQAECAAFQRARFKLKSPSDVNWDALAALRVGLALKDQTRGARLQELQSDLPDLEAVVCDTGAFSEWLRRAHELFEWKCSSAVDWLLEEVGVEDRHRPALRRGLGAALINSLDAAGRPGQAVGGLFAGHSLLEHSCTPNTFTTPWGREDGNDVDEEDDDELGVGAEHVLVAARDIARGEHLSLSYRDDPLRGTTVRRLELAWRGFLCRCALCQDPDEAGLHFEAWHCDTCSRGGKPVLVSMAAKGRWRCDGCDRQGSMLDPDHSGGGGGGDSAVPEGVRTLVRRMEELLAEDAEMDLEEWEDFIDGAIPPRGPLHPTHHVVLQAKKELIGMDRTDAALPQTHDEAVRMEDHCRDLLGVVDVLRPGINPYRRDLLARLYLFNTTRLSLHVSAARAQPQLWEERRADIEVLKENIAVLIHELQSCTVSPYDKVNFASVVEEFKALCERGAAPPP